MNSLRQDTNICLQEKKTTDAKHVELNFQSETVAMVIRSLWEAGMELTPNLKREEVVSFFFFHVNHEGTLVFGLAARLFT